MIWPEFEDETGELIESGVVLPDGIARMWIINDDLRPYHQERIKVGMKEYFMEGMKKTGECEIVELMPAPNDMS